MILIYPLILCLTQSFQLLVDTAPAEQQQPGTPPLAEEVPVAESPGAQSLQFPSVIESGHAPIYAPSCDQWLEAVLVREQQFAEQLRQEWPDNLHREWSSYIHEERQKGIHHMCREYRFRSFDQYLDKRYRRGRKAGIILFGVGFAPIGFGLWILPLGDYLTASIALAGFGGAVIAAGAVVWGVKGAKLNRYRRARDAVNSRLHVQWLGPGRGFAF